MRTLRVWIVLSWIALPGVIFGGAFLMRRLSIGDPSPFQMTWLRAGHAHGGVLFLMSLLYYWFLDETGLSARMKRAGCFAFFFGIGALAGGFFLHAIVGRPQEASIGNALSVGGAALLASAIGVLIYGLIGASSRRQRDQG